MGNVPSVAVQHLRPGHRPEIVRHLLRLPVHDRRLRFGRAIQDAVIETYVSELNFDRDRIFGILSPQLELLGVAHLALDPSHQLAELGLSVDPECRSLGYGFALLQRGVLHAANLGFSTLFMVCLAENGIMMHLARKAGLKVVVSSGEADARLALNRRENGGALQEVMADQLALVDCLLKQQTLWMRAA